MELYGNIAQRWTDVTGEAVYFSDSPTVISCFTAEWSWSTSPEPQITCDRNFYTTSKPLYLIS